jgi:hypothetical protein
MSNTPQQTIKYPELKVLVGNFFKYALSQYKLFIIVCTVTAALGLVYGKLQPHTYKATSTFIVEDKSGSRGGGLSGLASQFGIDVGGLTGGGAGLFDGDNILEIMKSRSIIEKVLLTKREDALTKKTQTYADFYLGISKLGTRLQNKGINLANLNFASINENSTHSYLQDSILYTIFLDINKHLIVDKKNKKSSIITMDLESPNQVFSKEFSETLIDKTSEMYIEIKTGNLSKSINKIQKKADSLQYALNSKNDIRNYINLSIPNEGVARDKTISGALYGEVVKNLETMKLSLINQTPVIQILDQAKYPLLDQRLQARYYILIGFAVGFVLSFFYIVFKYTS